MDLTFNSSPLSRLKRNEPHGQSRQHGWSRRTRRHKPRSVRARRYRRSPSSRLRLPFPWRPRETTTQSNSVMTPANSPISTMTRCTLRPFAVAATTSTMPHVIDSSCMASPFNRCAAAARRPACRRCACRRNTVRIVTRPGSPDVTRPMMLAAPPSGCARSAATRVLRLLRRNDGDDFAFIGEIERIEPEDLAKAPHLVANGGRSLVDLDRDLRRFGDLVEHGRDAAAGRIAKKARGRGGGQAASRRDHARRAQSLAIGDSKARSPRAPRMAAP